MNWTYDDCLVTADRHVFFKFMVKTLAEQHGLRATFMPKPFTNLTGSGCHAHVSLWDKRGKTNLFDQLVFPDYNHFIPWKHPEAVEAAIRMVTDRLSRAAQNQ